MFWLICDFDILRAQNHIFMFYECLTVFNYKSVVYTIKILAFFSLLGPLGGVRSGSVQSDKTLSYPSHADHYCCLN